MKKTGAIHLALVGLMTGRLTDKIRLRILNLKILYCDRLNYMLQVINSLGGTHTHIHTHTYTHRHTYANTHTHTYRHLHKNSF